MPMDRMAPTAVLTFQFSWTFHSIGIGSRANTMSVSTETLELKKAANLRFWGGMQVPSATPPQVNARGWHWKKTVTVTVSHANWKRRRSLDVQRFPVADNTVKTIVPMMKCLNPRDGVSRRRNRPTLTLVRHSAMRHSGWVMKLRWRPLTTLEGGLMYWTWRPAPRLTWGMIIIISVNRTVCNYVWHVRISTFFF